LRQRVSSAAREVSTSFATDSSFSIDASSSSSPASRTSDCSDSTAFTMVSLSARSFMSFCDATWSFQKSGWVLCASSSSMRFFNLGRSKMPPEVLGPAAEFL
jgi:hypothetical protein